MSTFQKIGFRETAQIIWKSFSYLKEGRIKYLASVVFSFAELGNIYLLPYLVSLITTLVYDGMTRQSLYKLLLILGCFLILTPIICIGEYWRRTTSYQGIGHIKKELFHKIERFPAQTFDEQEKGDLIGRLNLDTEKSVGMFRGYAIMGLIKFIVYESIGIVLLLNISWKLVLFSVIVSSISLLFSILMNPQVRGLERNASKKSAELISQIDETMTNMQVVKIFGLQDLISKKFLLTAKDVYHSKVKFRFINGLSYAIVDLLNFAVKPIAFIGIILFANVSIPQVVFIATILEIMAKGTKEFNAFIQYIQGGLVSAQRVFSALNLPSEETNPLNTKPNDTRDGTSACAVEFNNLRFSYEAAEVLRGVNLTIREGETIAFVGSSGSGKTTLIKLLLALYKVNGGSIKLFGKNINDMNLQKIRSLSAYVAQDSLMIDGSIAENIALGDESYDRERVIHAAKAAEIHSHIQTLPDGYDTILEQKGFGLSGGERQRISLARAIYKDAPIFLLDEATASLDIENEQSILSNLADIARNKTTIIVAHRLYTVRKADRIAVFEAGELVELGTHDGLIKKSGRYQKLYQEMGNSL